MDHSCRDPLDDARVAGLSVCIVELGDWFPATLVSEYDRAAREIRINAEALRRLSRKSGETVDHQGVRAAVAHELYHHEVAEGRITAARNRMEAEREADKYVRARYGIDAGRFERILR